MSEAKAKSMFRLLRADEIDCRIGSVKQPKDKKPGGVSLLLYKDARCDMAILDETVGPSNWQNVYSRDNANCTVQIWDDQKECWISKENVGSPSNTEAEKGLASDSFKRACVCWGIGRELYTAPFIWISGDPNTLKYEKFTVKDIGYLEETRVINKLVIINARTGNVVYDMKHPVNPDIVEPEITPQNVVKSEERPGKAQNAPASGPMIKNGAEVTTQNTVPQMSPEMLYMQTELKQIEQRYSLDSKAAKDTFKRMYMSLVQKKVVANKKLIELTKPEIDLVLKWVYETFEQETAS